MTYGRPNHVQLTYGKTGPTGTPELTNYNVGGTITQIADDPTTGQALMDNLDGVDTLFVYDGIGNPVGLLLDSGSDNFNEAFDPYGVGTLTTGNADEGYAYTPFQTKDGLQDRATGLVKFGARWYDDVTGTWIQQDALDAPLDPANANRYSYAGDDPINNYDPTGAVTFLGCAGSALLGSALIVGVIFAPEVEIPAGVAGGIASAGALGSVFTTADQCGIGPSSPGFYGPAYPVPGPVSNVAN